MFCSNALTNACDFSDISCVSPLLISWFRDNSLEARQFLGNVCLPKQIRHRFHIIDCLIDGFRWNCVFNHHLHARFNVLQIQVAMLFRFVLIVPFLVCFHQSEHIMTTAFCEIRFWIRYLLLLLLLLPLIRCNKTNEPMLSKSITLYSFVIDCSSFVAAFHLAL